MISIKNLSFSFFNTDKKALDSIDLEIGRGEFVAVTGPSGCGKSTLAMAIGGYIPHVFEGNIEGTVTVDGDLTTSLSLSDLATRVGIVQQDPESQLCTLNVTDEVAFGPENLSLPRDEVRRRVDAALDMVSASHLRDRHVYELSGGEKQRIAIASILAMGPGMLILDEPTSNLDPSSTTGVLNAIHDLKKLTGMTIMVIEHKLDKVMGLADRLIVMENGRIALDGKPDEILSRYHDRMKNMGIRLPDRNRFSAGPDSGWHECTPTVKAENLGFRYGDKEAIKDVSFVACRSEVTGIIGPNGSGKSTFLAHLLGLNRPQSGKITVLDVDISHAKTSTLAKKVGYVFQNPNHQIFERTVLDETSFACRNFGFDMQKAETLASVTLKRYGLDVYSSKHPLGLSFGEKRRLNLCSILPHGPEIVVLDEPFVGQDYFNVVRMIHELDELKKEGKTVILVSHDIDMVYKHCDRIVMFKSGRIVVNDTPSEALKKIESMGMKDFLPGEHA